MNPTFDRRARSGELSAFFSMAACQTRFATLNGVSSNVNPSSIVEKISVNTSELFSTDTEEQLITESTKLTSDNKTTLSNLEEGKGSTAQPLSPNDDNKTDNHPTATFEASCGIPMPSVKLQIPSLPSMLGVEDEDSEGSGDVVSTNDLTKEQNGESGDNSGNGRPLHRVELLRTLNKGQEGHPLETELAVQFVKQHAGDASGVRGRVDTEGQAEFKWD
jgi:hypothetical protein